MDQSRIEVCSICKSEFDKLDLDNCENCGDRVCCFCSIDGTYCSEECEKEYEEIIKGPK